MVTPDEMAAVDAAAPEDVAVLVARAGAGVARAAARLLVEHAGGVYGRRVLVLAGKGNNGADGRAAADRLRWRGAHVVVVDAASLGPGCRLPSADLVVDAAYGTGLARSYQAPDAGRSPVLAVDIPSGLSGLTGAAVDGSSVPRATATATFAALKPGLLLGDGPVLAGAVEVVDIGVGSLVAARAGAWLVVDADVAARIPPRAHDAHKWQAAVGVVAGSPGMSGAPWMVSRAALRAGAGYVRLGIPGMAPAAAGLPPGELVATALPERDWDDAAADGLERFAALVVGPGLGIAGRGGDGGSGPDTPVGRLLGRGSQPAVVDADGLNALGSFEAVAEVAARRRHPIVLTPHAGEFARLAGGPPGADRIAAVRDAARRSGAVVALKGSTTVVADPDGQVRLAAAGSSRLATAGTGDVLAGVIGALLARGVPALDAAAVGAHVHGRAAGTGLAVGLVASDLPELIAAWLSAHEAG